MKCTSVGRVTIVATLIVMSTATPFAAIAEPTPTPTSDPARNPIEQFRIDRENYANAMKIRNINIKNINITFKSACDNAALDYKSAMSIARTPDQKNLAAQARKSAISAAIIARDSAITALGPEPLPPLEPAKQFKAPKGKTR
jgi:ribosomal protein L5